VAPVVPTRRPVRRNLRRVQLDEGASATSPR
jgi:hypothetical protein